MKKLNSVSVLVNGVPFPFCQDCFYTVLVTASPKRIPETEFGNQKPPLVISDFGPIFGRPGLSGGLRPAPKEKIRQLQQFVQIYGPQ
jgi:hypothetical protein